MFNLKISAKLYLGFGVILTLLIAVIGFSLWEVTSIKESSTRIVNLRMPTAEASQKMLNNINASLATLRGWMLVENENFKKQRSAIWEDIEITSKKMDVLSQSWTNSKNVEKWTEFKTVLAEFKTAQQLVEDIVHTQAETPATQILVVEAAPRAGIMVKSISNMIDLELNAEGENSGDRIQILGMMADVRGTLGLGLANIRAYLLTGELKFRDGFNALWKKNERRFNDLSAVAHLLTFEQKKNFDEFSKKRKEFSSLPAKMFEIRSSEKWNMGQYLLLTEAAPRANKLMEVLSGELQPDGTRTGGMVNNQRKLLINDADENTQRTEELVLEDIMLLVVSLSAGVVIAFLIARSISKPIIGITDVMSKLSNGNLETEIPGQDRRDEIGDMAKALLVFKDGLQEAEHLRIEQENAKIAAAEQQRSALNQLADTFEKEVGSVIDLVSSATTELQSASSQLSSTASDTSELATTVATASEEASVNVQTVAASTEELSASINEISSQVAISTSVSERAVDVATQTTQTIEDLSLNVSKIGEVIGLITGIAEQTNLLALNATIESARAGDAGKGFAVVASEVKNLANQTSRATKEITDQISHVQSGTSGAVAAIETISSVITEMSEISAAVAAAVQEQTAATDEIARNVEQAASGTHEVTTNIQSVGHAATDTGTGAGQVETATQNLSRQSESMREKVASFLSDVRC